MKLVKTGICSIPFLSHTNTRTHSSAHSDAQLTKKKLNWRELDITISADAVANTAANSNSPTPSLLLQPYIVFSLWLFASLFKRLCGFYLEIHIAVGYVEKKSWIFKEDGITAGPSEGGGA